MFYAVVYLGHIITADKIKADTNRLDGLNYSILKKTSTKNIMIDKCVQTFFKKHLYYKCIIDIKIKKEV